MEEPMAEHDSRPPEPPQRSQATPAVAHPAAGGVTVEVRELTVALGERLLLDHAAAQFAAGHVTLVIGVSGAGKSTLLRVLAGLLDPQEPGVQLAGGVLFGGVELSRAARCRRVGLVFQEPALFDELSPRDNVLLALAHSATRPATGRRQTARQLLAELQVPEQVRTVALSGGQRQRLSFARALAHDPEVMLYDEPTGGLDAVTARQVAKLIQATHATHPKTSIVVTHDYQALLPIADRVYLLDPATHSLREIQPSQWAQLREYLQPWETAAALQPVAAPSRGTTWGKRLVESAGNFLAATGDVVAAAGRAPFSLLPTWRSPRWGLRFCWHYLRLVAGPSAWFYLAIMGIIIGFVTTHFTFRFLPYARYTQPLLIEDLLIAMGFALYRILIPILATILIAARCGAAVAADVGGKAYGHQLDAMGTLGIRPQAYLLTPILYAFLIGTPLLTLLAYFTASSTSLVTFTITHAAEGPDFWDLHFHRRLVDPDLLFFVGTWWLLSKLVICALGSGLVAYYQGARRKYSTSDVSDSITATILWSTLYVLVVHFIFAFFEFEQDRLDTIGATAAAVVARVLGWG